MDGHVSVGLLDYELSNFAQERVELGVQQFLDDRPFALGVNMEWSLVRQLIREESFCDLLLELLWLQVCRKRHLHHTPRSLDPLLLSRRRICPKENCGKYEL